jgi:site-specific recombinase XerD
MSTELQPRPNLADLVPVVCDRLNSHHSRRVYARHIRDVLDYATYKNPGMGFSRPLVQAWKQDMLARGLSPQTINQALSAARALAYEAEANGWLDSRQAMAIRDIDGIPVRGDRAGMWLTADQALELLCIPDQGTATGQRDWVALVLMLGCGLRREECISVDVSQVQRRDGRCVIVDLVGKGGRLRMVPIPQFAAIPLQAWAQRLYAAYKNPAMSLLPRMRGENPEERISSFTVWNIVKKYAKQIGVENLSPHDLRRSFAKLARAGGSPLEQIQVSLGHSTVATTDRYLGTALDLQKSACDYLGV